MTLLYNSTHLSLSPSPPSQAEGLLGSAMTYTLFEYIREHGRELVEVCDQPPLPDGLPTQVSVTVVLDRGLLHVITY